MYGKASHPPDALRVHLSVHVCLHLMDSPGVFGKAPGPRPSVPLVVDGWTGLFRLAGLLFLALSHLTPRYLPGQHTHSPVLATPFLLWLILAVWLVTWKNEVRLSEFTVMVPNQCSRAFPFLSEEKVGSREVVWLHLPEEVVPALTLCSSSQGAYRNMCRFMRKAQQSHYKQNERAGSC